MNAKKYMNCVKNSSLFSSSEINIIEEFINRESELIERKLLLIKRFQELQKEWLYNAISELHKLADSYDNMEVASCLRQINCKNFKLYYPPYHDLLKELLNPFSPTFFGKMKDQKTKLDALIIDLNDKKTDFEKFISELGRLPLFNKEKRECQFLIRERNYYNPIDNKHTFFDASLIFQQKNLTDDLAILCFNADAFKRNIKKLKPSEFLTWIITSVNNDWRRLIKAEHEVESHFITCK